VRGEGYMLAPDRAAADIFKHVNVTVQPVFGGCDSGRTRAC
jgi:hypothetical protein